MACTEGSLWLRPVTQDDLSLVGAVFDRLATYSMIVDGVARRTDAASDFVKSRPHGCDPSQKHAFVAVHHQNPVGLVDLIADYPDGGTVFIGLLAVAEPKQRSGLGRATFALAEAFARERLQATKLRLAVVATNPVSGFWCRMGFVATGVTRPYSGETAEHTVALMEKRLA